MELILLEEVDQSLVDFLAEAVLVLHLVAGVFGEAEDEEELVEGHLVFEERKAHHVVLLYYLSPKVLFPVGMFLEVRSSSAFCR